MIDFKVLKSDQKIYLDNNATTPLASLLVPKVSEWLEAWGNPSSIHWSGRSPKNLLRSARQKLSLLIGCSPLELIFTSGGSEANNLALKGLFSKFKNMRNQIIISAVEHPSVREAAFYLEKHGAQVDVIPVNKNGEMDMATYEGLLGPQTLMVSVMFANNETGSIFPIKKMAQKAHDVGALFHCDAVQALGKVIVDVTEWGVDLASFSGHKFYSLKGAGALYVRKGISLDNLIHGGGQERGRRAGTENVLAIASWGEMATYAPYVQQKMLMMAHLRDELQNQICSQIPNVKVTAALSKRLPNTLSLTIDGVDGESLLMNLDMRGFAVSTGAACSAGSPEPSPVLLAMGLTREEAQSSLRLSIGWSTEKEELELFAKNLKEVVEHLRSFHFKEKAGHAFT